MVDNRRYRIPSRRLAGALAALAWIAASVFAAAPARADDGGTYLSWWACPGNRDAAPGVPFDCLPEGGSVYSLVGTFNVARDIPNVVSMDADVAIAFPGLASVPPFWSIEPDGCNASAFALVKGMPSGCGDHLNAFCFGDTNRCDLIYSASVQPGTNVLHISITASVGYPTTTTTLIAGRRYFAFMLNIPMSGAIGCSGCTAPTAIGFSRGIIYSIDSTGTLAPPAAVTGSYPGANACATANDGYSDCTAVPTRRMSWGRLKSLYR